ncbi:MAG: hypothetical protein Q8L90_16400 [Bacteroidota bacterium]|nr:hypothetical protein [Bacteroidota bacterium]
MKREILILLKDKTVDKALLFIDSMNGLTKIKFIYRGIEIDKEGEFPFFVLVDLRKDLEKLGYLLICNGSRIDVYPSRISSVGSNAYLLKPNQKALLTDLVNIFDSTDKIDLITTIETQKEYCLNIVKKSLI